jgi:3-hydroxyacyl-[acyl-carrier-protein] dehydratase
MLDIKEIQKILPHRFPFLLVDKLVKWETGKKAVGLKNVTINEPYFEGHFPDNPVMPGVLILEAMAQVASLLAFQSGIETENLQFVNVEMVKFRQPVLPGDQLFIEVTVKDKSEIRWIFSSRSYVNEKLTTEAEFTASIAHKEP